MSHIYAGGRLQFSSAAGISGYILLAVITFALGSFVACFCSFLVLFLATGHRKEGFPTSWTGMSVQGKWGEEGYDARRTFISLFAFKDLSPNVLIDDQRV